MNLLHISNLVFLFLEIMLHFVLRVVSLFKSGRGMSELAAAEKKRAACFLY